MILLRGAKEFLSKPLAPRKAAWDSVEKSLGKSSPRFSWIGLALFLFALPFGLWSMRFDPEATGPVLIGSVINLFFVSVCANTIAFYKKRSGQGKVQLLRP